MNPDLVQIYSRINALEAGLRRVSGIETPFDPISPFLALPELRGFWPMSSVNESGNPQDISGQGRTLTNNAAAVRAVYNSLVPYVALNGTTQYLNRANEAGLAITGAVTLGGWFWFSDSSASIIYSKSSGGGTYEYSLERNSASNFIVSANGTATFVVTGSNPAVGAWSFITGRYTPSTEIALFVNNVKTTNTTSIPASLFNSTSALGIGAHGGGGFPLNGRVSACFLCAAAVSDTLIGAMFQSTRALFGV